MGDVARRLTKQEVRRRVRRERMAFRKRALPYLKAKVRRLRSFVRHLMREVTTERDFAYLEYVDAQMERAAEELRERWREMDPETARGQLNDVHASIKHMCQHPARARQRRGPVHPRAAERQVEMRVIVGGRHNGSVILGITSTLRVQLRQLMDYEKLSSLPSTDEIFTPRGDYAGLSSLELGAVLSTEVISLSPRGKAVLTHILPSLTKLRDD